MSSSPRTSAFCTLKNPCSAQPTPQESMNRKHSLLKLVNTTAWPEVRALGGRVVMSISFFVKVPVGLLLKKLPKLFHSSSVSLNHVTTGRFTIIAFIAPVRSTPSQSKRYFGHISCSTRRVLAPLVPKRLINSSLNL